MGRYMSRLSLWTSRNKSRPRIASSSSAEMLSIKFRMLRSLLCSRWIRVFRAPILSDNQRHVVVFVRLNQNSRIGQVCIFKRLAMFAKYLRDFLVNPKERWYQVCRKQPKPHCKNHSEYHSEYHSGYHSESIRYWERDDMRTSWGAS